MPSTLTDGAPQFAGPLVDYTPPSPLPVFTTERIIEALRTSHIARDQDAEPEQYLTDRGTYSWGTGGDIQYRLDLQSMSAFEAGRIDEAYETWDDLIAVGVVRNQDANPGSDDRFTQVRFVATGDDAGRAYDLMTGQELTFTQNEYGTADWLINRTLLSLGRTFSRGEFDGLDGAGNPDGGVFRLAYGRRGMETILHEIGHSLGLSHPGFYNDGKVSVTEGMRFAQDSRRDTIMSYLAENRGSDSSAAWNGIFASTPMVYDIAAIQRVYGADILTRLGDTTYGFGNTTGRQAYDFLTTIGSVFTIYDAGGRDTIDASAYSGNATIDLTPGSYSSVGQAAGNAGPTMRENIGIAFNTLIENAVGGGGNDRITGNNAANRLVGGDGFDTLVGGNANDTLDGGGGVDQLDGGIGNDVLIGGQGADTLRGFTGTDSARYQGSPEAVVVRLDLKFGLAGDALNDIFDSIENVVGSAYDDQLVGDDYANVLSGLGGADTLDGGAGRDSLYGGAGNDEYRVDSFFDRAIEIFAGDGIDRVFASSFFVLGDHVEHLTLVGTDALQGYGNALANDLVGNDGNDYLTADAGNDTLTGGLGDDTLVGGGDDDLFVGGAGADALFGDGGVDEASYVGSPAGVTVNLLTGETSGGDAVGDTFESIENLVGSFLSDWLTGDGQPNRLNGSAGADILGGLGGDDTLVGGPGPDRLFVDDRGDVVVELPLGGRDTVYSWVTLYGLAANVEDMVLLDADAFHGAGGNGLGNDAGNRMTGNGVANFLQSFGGNDTLLGGGGDDHLIGGDDDDWIYLDPGADRLEGGDGYDTLVFSSPTIFDFAGGLFSGDAAGDLGWSGFEAIRGSAGDDRIVATTASANVAVFYGGAGNDAIAGGAGADTLHGDAGDDRLQGHDADDLLRPGTGSDTVDGGLGVDTVSYSDLGAAVRLDLARTIPQATGAGGLDTLTGVENAEGGAGADTLRGDAGPNALWGLGANDLLIGRGGSDRLDGGAGTDTLTGGAGGDVFVFGSALGPDNVDHITDYGAALDRLYLIGPAGPFAILPAGTLAPAALDILGDATAPTAATRVVYDPATGTLAFDPDGTGAAAAQPFAVLDNLPATLAPTQIDVGP